MRETLAAVIVASLIVASCEAERRPPVVVPTPVESVADQVQQAIGILDAAGRAALSASDRELAAYRNRAIPQNVHDQLDRFFKASAEAAVKAYDTLRSGQVNDRARLRATLDPVVENLGQLKHILEEAPESSRLKDILDPVVEAYMALDVIGR